MIRGHYGKKAGRETAIRNVSNYTDLDHDIRKAFVLLSFDITTHAKSNVKCSCVTAVW